MKLIFARHGESEANVAGIISNRDLPHSLTEKGRRQALALAEKLSTEQVVALHSSPILRAQETAQILAEQLQVPLKRTTALREFDCGIMEGRGDEAAWQAHDAVTHAWDVAQDYEQRISGGESYHDMQARFVPYVEKLVAEFSDSDGSVVLISHGSMLHRMLPLVLTNIDLTFSKAHPLGNCVCVVTKSEAAGLRCLKWDDVSF